jgi:hypothetical protein
MVMTALLVSSCALMSGKALQATPRDLDQRTLWVVRAFLVSFATPVVCFCTIVLRHTFSNECVQQKANLDASVIEATTVAGLLCLCLFWLANKACLKEPVDLFFEAFLALVVFVAVVDVHQTAKSVLCDSHQSCNMLFHRFLLLASPRHKNQVSIVRKTDGTCRRHRHKH